MECLIINKENNYLEKVHKRDRRNILIKKTFIGMERRGFSWK